MWIPYIESQKMVAVVTSPMCRVSAISTFCQLTTQIPSITNCLVAIVHTKPVNSNFSSKVGCHGNVPQQRWSPISHTIPTAHPSPQPKQHLDRFNHFCTHDHTVSLYFTMGRPFPPPKKIAPFHGDLDRHLIRGYLGPPKSSTQMASRSVQPFLQGSLVWQTTPLGQ